MPGTNPRLTASIAGLSLYAMLMPIPVVCFLGTFLTDLTYANTADMQWANMSAWLLAIGLIVAIFAVVAGLIDLVWEPRLRALPVTWVHVIGFVLALILSIFNSFVHSRDAYTSVVPTGLTLSAIVAVILLVTAWSGWTLVFRYRAGVEGEA